MKKATILMTVAILISAWSSVLMAAAGTGTESDWDLDLSFKAGTATDLLDVTVGTNSTADETLKPPPLPGAEITDNPANAYVRAYVVTSAARQAAKSIATTNKMVWAVEVDAENVGDTVTVDLTDSDFYAAYYPVTIVVPGANVVGDSVKKINSNDTKTGIELFTSDGAPKRIYFVTGTSRTFAASSGTDDNVIGLVEMPGKTFPSGTPVKLFSGTLSACGSETASDETDASGMFEFTGVAADGDYVVQIAKPYYLGSECEVSQSDDGEATTCGTIYAGDFSQNGKTDFPDLDVFKTNFNKNKTSNAAEWDSIKHLDINGSEAIDFPDLSMFKDGFNKQANLKCGS